MLLALQAVHHITHQPFLNWWIILNGPGLQRRMEQIIPGLYSDEAHTPD